MCCDSIFNVLKRVGDGSFSFLCKTLVFIFLPFLNLGAQIRCPQNRYTDLKSALDQPLRGKGSLTRLKLREISAFEVHYGVDIHFRNTQSPLSLRNEEIMLKIQQQISKKDQNVRPFQKPLKCQAPKFRFSDDFRRGRSYLILLNLLSISSEVWRQSLMKN